MTSKEIKDDNLTYLTAHVLPAVIRLYPWLEITEQAETAVRLANIALERINQLNQLNQLNQQKLKNAYTGETNGWRWEIHPWDFDFLGNTVLPETTWYVNIHGKEQYLTADQLSGPKEAFSTISQFCKFHPQGRINPSHPIKPFKVNNE